MPSAPPDSDGAERDDELVMSLVQHALEHPVTERADYLSRACAGDGSLLDQVQRYLSWDERMKGFLLHPRCPSLADEPLPEPGQLLENRFRIIRRVGGGGMGTVYEAQYGNCCPDGGSLEFPVYVK
jgi:hypothetical protein